WYSPGHHTNMMSDEYREVGVGIARNAAGEAYYTMLHGARGSVLTAVINGGDATTNVPQVTVYLSNETIIPEGAPQIIGRATEVRFSNGPDFAGAAWIPWARVVSWTLSDGPGVKEVWVEFRDATGRVATASDTIELVN
ncbi:MAG: hypothetical protein JXB47_10055, partial [Anaerolineae bacterium]|nr:hypothetical protein [Anaerolineae bacterium]